MKRIAACALAALLSTPTAGAAGEPPPRIETREIGDGLYLLNGNGYDTNIGLLVGSDAAILIDPSPGEAQLDALHEAVRALVADAEVWIVNTHDHPDHAGGNSHLASKGMRVIEDGTPLPLGISSIDVVSHSARDRLLFLPDHNIVFVGDVFDNSWHPTFYAGGMDGLGEAVATILAMGDAQTLIVPGHGAPTGKTTLRAFHHNTLDWVDRLQALRARGYSVDRIMTDPEAMAIVARFDTQGRDPFLPEASLRRFIERTLAVTANARSSLLPIRSDASAEHNVHSADFDK